MIGLSSVNDSVMMNCTPTMAQSVRCHRSGSYPPADSPIQSQVGPNLPYVKRPARP